MSEPMKDMSLAPMAAIRCGNAECPFQSVGDWCNVTSEYDCPEECEDYRPAERNAAAGKPTIVSPYTSTELAEFATIRTERDQARAELTQIRRALELTGTVLPEIDEAVYEYSPVGIDNGGEWSDIWWDGQWRVRQYPGDRNSRLCRRRRRVRRAPTDQDAIEQPRRECWVRDYTSQQWRSAPLLAVTQSGSFSATRYIVLLNGAVQSFAYGEIEVEQ